MVGEERLPTFRYRCSQCGNLTRFDVFSTKRVRAYYHYTLGGSLRVEEEEVLAEEVERVVCRWCGSSQAVESIEALEAEVASEQEGA